MLADRGQVHIKLLLSGHLLQDARNSPITVFEGCQAFQSFLCVPAQASTKAIVPPERYLRGWPLRMLLADRHMKYAALQEHGQGVAILSADALGQILHLSPMHEHDSKLSSHLTFMYVHGRPVQGRVKHVAHL